MGIDFVWLTLIAKNFYGKHLGYLMKNSPNLGAAVVFYLLFVFGILVLVILPAFKEGSILKALLWGSLFGLVTYATYDLTNLATIKNWPFIVTLVDLAWGTFVSATVSTIGFLLAQGILKK